MLSISQKGQQKFCNPHFRKSHGVPDLHEWWNPGGWNQCLSHSSHRMLDFAPIIYAGLPHSPPKGNILVDESPWWRPWILCNIVSLLSAEFVQLNTVGPTVSKFIGYLWIWLHWQMGQKSSGSIYIFNHVVHEVGKRDPSISDITHSISPNVKVLLHFK